MLAASLYNAYATSSAVCAAVQTGLLDAVHQDLKVDIEEFAAAGDLDSYVLRGVWEALAREQILSVVQAEPLIITKGAEFDDIWLNKGYFLWLVRGYGDMLSRVGELAHNSARAGVFGARNGRAIAQAGKDYGAHFVCPIVNDLIAGLDFEVLADLGCGSANRIIQLAGRYPTKRFIGVEVDSGAVDVARAAVAAANLSDRVEIVQDDVRKLRERPEYAHVDTVLSFFLGHDFWPREDCLATLDQIRVRLPRARDFLLSDTYHSASVTPDPPIFTSGFELTHAVMGQRVPTIEQWVDLFEDSVWELRSRTALDIAYSEIFHLVPKP
ncbi:methyltransferase domain-containing protein [Actinokineospora sp.]|uniref:methyltransferase domain-containing protein n=1 Tax=Actinokineospora sp. TaxID=1872133 RepID=UPI0040384B91